MLWRSTGTNVPKAQFAYRRRRYMAYCVGIPSLCVKAERSSQALRTLANSCCGCHHVTSLCVNFVSIGCIDGAPHIHTRAIVKKGVSPSAIQKNNAPKRTCKISGKNYNNRISSPYDKTPRKKIRGVLLLDTRSHIRNCTVEIKEHSGKEQKFLAAKLLFTENNRDGRTDTEFAFDGKLCIRNSAYMLYDCKTESRSADTLGVGFIHSVKAFAKTW